MKNLLTNEELVELVLASFEAEKMRDVQTNRTYLHEDFKVTNMTLNKQMELFPRLEGSELQELMEKAFTIKGRDYQFKSIAADEKTQTVFVEFVESYPDPKTGKVYVTPQVSICQIKDRKIYRTRHYMDPRVSFEDFDKSALDDAYS